MIKTIVAFLSSGRKNKDKHARAQPSPSHFPDYERDTPSPISHKSISETFYSPSSRMFSLSSTPSPTSEFGGTPGTDRGASPRRATPTRANKKGFFRSVTDLSKIQKEDVARSWIEMDSPSPPHYQRKAMTAERISIYPQQEYGMIGSTGSNCEPQPRVRGSVKGPLPADWISSGSVSQIPACLIPPPSRPRSRSLGSHEVPDCQAEPRLPPLPPLPRLPQLAPLLPLGAFESFELSPSKTSTYHTRNRSRSISSIQTRRDAAPGFTQYRNSPTKSSRRSPLGEMSASPQRSIGLANSSPIHSTQTNTLSSNGKRKVPELDKTWANFLFEAEEDRCTWSKTSPTITGTSSPRLPDATIAIAERVTMKGVPVTTLHRATKPLLPPPNQPLPPIPLLDLSFGSSSPQSPTERRQSPHSESPSHKLSFIPILPTLRLRHQIDDMPTPPMSPNEDVVGGIKRCHSSLDVAIPSPDKYNTSGLDQVISLTDDPSFLSSRSSSSLDYLKSVALLSEKCPTGTTSSSTSLSADEISHPCTLSDVSLSLFPTPPSQAVISSSESGANTLGVQTLGERGKDTLLQNWKTLGLPTPPITPNCTEFPSHRSVRDKRYQDSGALQFPRSSSESQLPSTPTSSSMTFHPSGKTGASASSPQCQWWSGEYFGQLSSTPVTPTQQKICSTISPRGPTITLKLGDLQPDTSLDPTPRPSPRILLKKPLFARMPSYSSSAGWVIQGDNRPGIVDVDPMVNDNSDLLLSPPLDLHSSINLNKHHQLVSLAGALGSELDASSHPSPRSPSSPLTDGIEWGQAV